MPERRLLLLALALAGASLAFLTIDARGSWSFLLPFRGIRLLALATVGTSVGLATVLFQTVSGNRLLTPSIMGFDALYLLIQSLLVLGLGGIGFAVLDMRLKFLLETALMIVAAAALFSALLGRGRNDLHRMLLVGIIFGALFRGLASFVQRLLNPNDFAILQGASFARFSAIDTQLLAIGMVMTAAGAVFAWSWRTELDVMALGRSTAIGLGVDHDRLTRRVLLIVSALVAASTALVGPVAFLGLLVASLARRMVQAPRHALILPAAAMIGAIVLIGGQTIFERWLGMASTLSVVVEFAGGLLFLVLLLGGRTR